MIVQVASDGKSAFIISQQDHASVSGVFASLFGNDVFERLDPEEAMVYVAAHHDDGWEEIDQKASYDPRTGFIYHLTQTPMALLLDSGNKSPNANEAHHPYSGIISSMHTYGLYHGRYGLSDKVYIDMIGDEWVDKVKNMLSVELERQARLKNQFKEMGQESLVKEENLFRNYKLLQFFDTLALYIQTVAPDQMTDSQFLNVPQSKQTDSVITATFMAPNLIELNPWPFKGDHFEVSTRGRVMKKAEAGKSAEAVRSEYLNSPASEQIYQFQRGG